MGSYNARRWSEVVTLLRFRENIRNIVPLVAPCIHVYWRIENAERRVHHQPELRYGLRNTKTRCKVVGIRIFQALGKAILCANKRGRSSVVEGQV